MNLHNLIRGYITTNDSVLDLCCGIGDCSHYLKVKRLVGVDIYSKYLDRYKERRPDIELICGNAIETCKSFNNNEFDVVMLIDAIEHFYYEDAKELIKQAERIANKKILIFTPECQQHLINLNKPHSAWGIEGGDEFQDHKSGFERNELISMGYTAIQGNMRRNKYDKSTYYEMFYVKDK